MGSSVSDKDVWAAAIEAAREFGRAYSGPFDAAQVKEFKTTGRPDVYAVDCNVISEEGKKDGRGLYSVEIDASEFASPAEITNHLSNG